MLVIGFNAGENSHASRDLEVDPTTDSPRKIHDALKKATGGADYTLIVCVEDGAEVASYEDESDYDLSEAAPDDSDADEDDENPDNLHEEEDDLDIDDADDLDGDDQ